MSALNSYNKRYRADETETTHSVKRVRFNDDTNRSKPVCCPKPITINDNYSSDSDAVDEKDLYKQCEYEYFVAEALKFSYRLINCPLPNYNGMELFIKWAVDMLQKCLACKYKSVIFSFIINFGRVKFIGCRYNDVIDFGTAPKQVLDALNMYMCKTDGDILSLTKQSLDKVLPDNVTLTLNTKPENNHRLSVSIIANIEF